MNIRFSQYGYSDPNNRYKLTQPTLGIASFAIVVRTHGEVGEGSALAAIVVFRVSR